MASGSLANLMVHPGLKRSHSTISRQALVKLRGVHRLTRQVKASTPGTGTLADGDAEILATIFPMLTVTTTSELQDLLRDRLTALAAEGTQFRLRPKDFFLLYDTAGCGSLDAAQFGAFVEALRIDAEVSLVLAVFGELDVDGSGAIAFAELTTGVGVSSEAAARQQAEEEKALLHGARGKEQARAKAVERWGAVAPKLEEKAAELGEEVRAVTALLARETASAAGVTSIRRAQLSERLAAVQAEHGAAVAALAREKTAYDAAVAETELTDEEKRLLAGQKALRTEKQRAAAEKARGVQPKREMVRSEALTAEAMRAILSKEKALWRQGAELDKTLRARREGLRAMRTEADTLRAKLGLGGAAAQEAAPAEKEKEEEEELTPEAIFAMKGRFLQLHEQLEAEEAALHQAESDAIAAAIILTKDEERVLRGHHAARRAKPGAVGAAAAAHTVVIAHPAVQALFAKRKIPLEPREARDASAAAAAAAADAADATDAADGPDASDGCAACADDDTDHSILAGGRAAPDQPDVFEAFCLWGDTDAEEESRPREPHEDTMASPRAESMQAQARLTLPALSGLRDASGRGGGGGGGGRGEDKAERLQRIRRQFSFQSAASLGASTSSLHHPHPHPHDVSDASLLRPSFSFLQRRLGAPRAVTPSLRDSAAPRFGGAADAAFSFLLDADAAAGAPPAAAPTLPPVVSPRRFSIMGEGGGGVVAVSAQGAREALLSGLYQRRGERTARPLATWGDVRGVTVK